MKKGRIYYHYMAKRIIERFDLQNVIFQPNLAELLDNWNWEWEQEQQKLRNKERIKLLMSDNKKRSLSQVSVQLNIHPRKVKELFNELNEEGYFN